MTKIVPIMTHDEQGAFCNAVLAPYASKPHESRGRMYEEDESKRRSPYERDRDRIIHSKAFRRLKYKTQVFVYHEGDHFRTRLTHSLEVAQVARSLARSLRLNEDLAETIALVHDLGHTPFAHLGEDILQECLEKRDSYFNHNEQTFRIVTELEKGYPSFDGLNLTWESLEGMAKHNGPILPGDEYQPESIKAFSNQFDLKLELQASAEAQIADAADGIAYNNHDIDDGLRAGIFTLDDMMEISHVKPIIEQVRKQYPNVPEKRLSSEVIRVLIGSMIDDLIGETMRRLEKHNPSCADDIRKAGEMVVAFSDEFEQKDKEMRAFLRRRMYESSTVNRTRFKMGNVIRDLFNSFINNPDCMPSDWYARLEKDGSNLERLVLDYIAGMTDKYALAEHRRLYDPYSEIL